MSRTMHVAVVVAGALLLALAGSFVSELSPVSRASCGSGPYYASTEVTAYAMGNQYTYPNGVQHEVVIGDAAGHYDRYPWGTCIYLPYDSITIKTADGGSVTRGAFYIWDCGSGMPDPNWVDIYHGRYKRPGDACCCGGVPCPGYCVDNSTTNSCDEAQAFGLRYYTIQPDSG